MKLYRIRICLDSALATPLKGDTIWGHIVWGIANHEGEQAVSEFLQKSRTNSPPLVVSSAFPEGFLCKHMQKPTERKETLSAAEYTRIKQYKKQKYEQAARYFCEQLQTMAPHTDNYTAEAFEKTSVIHNSINRFSNTVRKDGGLYASLEYWPKQKYFDVYAAADSAYTPERIIEVFSWAFENGYGADTSTGKGSISVMSTTAQEVTAKQTGKTYMALGPFILPQTQSVANLRADIFVRTGKIGGFFSSVLSPYKKTVVLYDEGAVFECAEPLAYIGSLVCDVHSDSRICQSGFAPVVPIGE